MADDKKVNELNEEDRNKLKELLDLLRTETGKSDDTNFLCTHCHCHVCTIADREGSPLKKDGKKK